MRLPRFSLRSRRLDPYCLQGSARFREGLGFGVLGLRFQDGWAWLAWALLAGLGGGERREHANKHLKPLQVPCNRPSKPQIPVSTLNSRPYQ